jgi:hypothetical protein
MSRSTYHELENAHFDYLFSRLHDDQDARIKWEKILDKSGWTEAEFEQEFKLRNRARTGVKK